MTTSVPSAVLTSAGYQAPAESAILAGVLSDLNTAFGGNLNPALNTPQGQIASSEAAIIGDANNQFLALANGIDPAFASGRMQDAIGRIYFLTRNPAQSTVVTATCSGLTGTVIPIGAIAVDQGGTTYFCSETGTIPLAGSIDLTFVCSSTGLVACPAGFLNAIYQAIPGWDSITNASPGVEGNDVETRADFEYRRQQSVAIASMGSNAAMLAAVFAVPGVLDAWVTDNPLPTASDVNITASISGTAMAVTAQPASSTGLILKVGQMVTGAGVLPGTFITSGSGMAWTVSLPQNIASEAMLANVGGVSLVKNSIYVSVYGGDSSAIGAAILTRKNPGCNYNGNTTVTVQDTNALYTPPYPEYSVTYETPTPTPVLFSIQMQSNANVPSNAIALVQAAVISAFTGADGGPRARIAGSIFASRFYAGIAALGNWSLIYSIQLGIAGANQNSVLMRADQVPTVVASGITVTFA